MNIVEVYNNFNEQLIILISGLSGSKKTTLAKKISKDFKLKMFNLEDYSVLNNDNTVKLSNDVTVTDWDHIDSYNWEQFNIDINNNKKDGLVVCGQYFTSDKINFKPDFHIHIKISKKRLTENRHEFIEKHPDKFPDVLNTPTESLIINQLAYPHYLEYLEKSSVDKFINANEITEEEVYDSAFSYLINMIDKFLEDNRNAVDKKLYSNINKTAKKDSSSDDSSKKIHLNNSTTETISEEPVYLGTTAV